MQHVNIKLFASQSEIDLVDAIGVFHQWIQDSAVPELLIDVADYKHVPDGPGIMLIGFEADYSLDQTGGRLGLLYNRKAPSELDAQHSLKQAYEAAKFAARKLEASPAFAGKLKFDENEVEIILNDRLATPNTDETWDALKPELDAFATELYGPEAYIIERRGEPRNRLTVGVRKIGSL